MVGSATISEPAASKLLLVKKSPCRLFSAEVIGILDARRRAMPFILCEYGHAMGNGPGGLSEYMELFDAYPVVRADSSGNGSTTASW